MKSRAAKNVCRVCIYCVGSKVFEHGVMNTIVIYCLMCRLFFHSPSSSFMYLIHVLLYQMLSAWEDGW